MDYNKTFDITQMDAVSIRASEEDMRLSDTELALLEKDVDAKAEGKKGSIVPILVLGAIATYFMIS